MFIPSVSHRVHSTASRRHNLDSERRIVCAFNHPSIHHPLARVDETRRNETKSKISLDALRQSTSRTRCVRFIVVSSVRAVADFGKIKHGYV